MSSTIHHKEISILVWNLQVFNDNTPPSVVDDLANFFVQFDIVCAVEVPKTTSGKVLVDLMNAVNLKSLKLREMYQAEQNICRSTNC